MREEPEERDGAAASTQALGDSVVELGGGSGVGSRGAFGDSAIRMHCMQKVEESKVLPGFWLKHVGPWTCQRLRFLWWVDGEHLKSVLFRTEVDACERSKRCQVSSWMHIRRKDRGTYVK